MMRVYIPIILILMSFCISPIFSQDIHVEILTRLEIKAALKILFDDPIFVAEEASSLKRVDVNVIGKLDYCRPYIRLSTETDSDIVKRIERKIDLLNKASVTIPDTIASYFYFKTKSIFIPPGALVFFDRASDYAILKYELALENNK